MTTFSELPSQLTREKRIHELREYIAKAYKHTYEPKGLTEADLMSKCLWFYPSKLAALSNSDAVSLFKFISAELSGKFMKFDEPKEEYDIGHCESIWDRDVRPTFVPRFHRASPHPSSFKRPRKGVSRDIVARSSLAMFSRPTLMKILVDVAEKNHTSAIELMRDLMGPLIVSDDITGVSDNMIREALLYLVREQPSGTTFSDLS